MLSITITYDGGDVVVNQHGISAEDLVSADFINRWATAAEEPCPHGHKCDMIKRMLADLTGKQVKLEG